ncbi:FAD-dependent oxidoreductase [Porticoccaceae bacterium]|nr:FAD-dependent oxidoreductase [Porticoccaceae bacterium]MDB9804785.1 FAD-dependent oxidoreductase [Porticoccaceae bacterium]
MNKNTLSFRGSDHPWKVLIIGAGIGGLSAGIALRKKGYDVEIIEKDPEWTVYGVGIIQQNNVIRAMYELGVIDDYIDAGYGFDHVKIFAPNGMEVAKIPLPPLVEGYPANVGIARPALQRVLAESTKASGADIRLGLTAETINDGGDVVEVTFSDGSQGKYDLVIGADGIYSQTRQAIFPEAPGPEFTGQSVWRYNFDRPKDMEGLHVYNGRVGVGLVPMSQEQIYMYVTTPEPENPHFEKSTLVDEMKARLNMACPTLHHFADEITDNQGVVYRPLEWLMLEGDWHSGRIGLLGDAVHSTTPHLGQGAGLAIEDALVLADELTKASTPEEAFKNYRDRRFERCDYIVKSSLGICLGQLGKGPLIDNSQATADSIAVVAKPI